MENKELAERLRIAAEILETGKEWEFYSKSLEAWHKPSLPIQNYLASLNEIRIKPWSLPAPPEGEQWHRNSGWKEGMIEDGERPLLDGELTHLGDMFLNYNDQWVHADPNIKAQRTHLPQKTSRPLPQKKTKNIVPLGPEDVPPLTAFKDVTFHPADWKLVTHCRTDGICDTKGQLLTFKYLMDHGYLIKRPTDADFVPAHKEIEE